MPVPLRRLLFCLLLVFCCSHKGWAVADDARADSVMERVFTYTRRSGLKASSYTSQLYVRTRLKTRRRGRWIKFVPGMFPLEKGENVYLSENHVVYRYRPPGQVDEKELTYYSTMPYLHDSSERVLDRFSLSIYEPNLFSDRILSPLHERNGRFYRYKYVYSYTEAADLIKWALYAYGYVKVLTTSSMICEVPVKLASKVDYVTLFPSSDIELYLPVDVDLSNDVQISWQLTVDSFTAPVDEGEVGGTLTATYKGESLGSYELITKTSVNRSNILYIFDLMRQLVETPQFRTVVIIISIIIGGYIGVSIILAYMSSQARRRGGRRR